MLLMWRFDFTIFIAHYSSNRLHNYMCYLFWLKNKHQNNYMSIYNQSILIVTGIVGYIAIFNCPFDVNQA